MTRRTLGSTFSPSTMTGFEQSSVEDSAVVRCEHIARAQRHLSNMVRDLVTEAAHTGHVRKDVAADELASYCLHALAAASSLPSKAAVSRLVKVTLTGLREA